MASSEEVIIRVQGPNGLIRFKNKSTDFMCNIFEKVLLSFLFFLIEQTYPGLSEIYHLWLDKENKFELSCKSERRSFSNGDMLYLTFDQESSFVNEDDVDKTLFNHPGIIYREKTAEYIHLYYSCSHNNNSKCVKCIPIEIFDEEYIKSIDPPLKHISFHVYLRRLMANSKQNILLDEIRCRIQPGCSAHAPWPNGVCTRCQPPTLILGRQDFRIVDNIMFENHEEVDSFIGYWRRTLCQRIGFLYGKYEVMDNIPLGVRARVHAIYEPPQVNTFDNVTLKDDENQEFVDSVARAMGYQKVGWILTDLLIDPNIKGKILNTRNVNLYLLSAQECITAATFQNKFPNVCRYSPSKTFGSKFVTVVVSGNTDGQIDFYGWQVSNQCMALVRDDCLLPTIDDPSLAYIRDQSPKQFIPDVFYKCNDEFKNSVMKSARPVPVEYFLVEVSVGFPLTPAECSRSSTFPRANRETIGEHQNLIGLRDFLTQPLKYFDDIHSMSFLCRKLDNNLRNYLLKTIGLNHQNPKQCQKEITSDNFLMIIDTLTKSLSKTPNSSYSADTSLNTSPTSRLLPQDTHPQAFQEWSCLHCTFNNSTPHFDSEGYLVCEICGIPKDLTH